MLLKNALDLKRSIEEYRQNMYDLARNKGVSDPEVIKISQKLDSKIIDLQKLLSGVTPHHKESFFIKRENIFEIVRSSQNKLNKEVI